MIPTEKKYNAGNRGESVTASFAQRHFHHLRKLARKGPVDVTIHGRTEMVILSRDAYASLIRAQEQAG